MKENIFVITISVIIIAVVGVGVYEFLNNKEQTVNNEKQVDNYSEALNSQTSSSAAEGNKENNQNQFKNMKHLITIKTNYGEIQFGTYDNDAPKTVDNFISLVNKGFYNGITFHRIVKGFVIQGGDPNCSAGSNGGPCGAGGPGYKFEDELNPAADSYKEGYKKGVVAMANSGPNTNGSQFFIMLENVPLDHLYSIFGKVVKGQEVVDVIGKVQTDSNNKPINPVLIEKVSISEIDGN